MAKYTKVTPGPLANGRHIRGIMLVIGGLMAIIGLFSVYYSFRENTPLLMIIGLFLIAIGIFIAVFSAKNEIKNIYCDKKGFCKILRGKYKCTGGCNNCIFAYRYLSLVDMNSDPDPVYFRNDFENEFECIDDQGTPKTTNQEKSFDVEHKSSLGTVQDGIVVTENVQVVSEGLSVEEIKAKIDRYTKLIQTEITKESLNEFKEARISIESYLAEGIPDEYRMSLQSLRNTFDSAIRQYYQAHNGLRKRTIEIASNATSNFPLTVVYTCSHTFRQAEVVGASRLEIYPDSEQVSMLKWRSQDDLIKKKVSVKKGPFNVPQYTYEYVWHSATFTITEDWPDKVKIEFVRTQNTFEMKSTDIPGFQIMN